jgi:hypothetical protein
VTDPRTHARYLTYRETHQYFRRADRPMLDWESWKALDAELTTLLPLLKTGTAEERARLKLVRALLLRD